MAEGQSAHRQKMEQQRLEYSYSVTRTGQIIAGIIVTIALIGAVVLVAYGHTMIGYASLITAIGLLIAPFFGKSSVKQPRDGKDSTKQNKKKKRPHHGK